MEQIVDIFHEEAAVLEMRERYIKELQDVEKTIETMENGNVNSSFGNMDIQSIENQISNLSSKDNSLTETISAVEENIRNNDKNRMSLSQIKNVNIKELSKRKQKLVKMVESYNEMSSQYNELSRDMNDMVNRFYFTIKLSSILCIHWLDGCNFCTLCIWVKFISDIIFLKG